LFDSTEQFTLTRAQDFLSANQNDLALADCQAVVSANPNSAFGYYLLGSAQEALKQTDLALKNYQQAIDLADAQGLSNLTVEAKVKMGYLLQAAGAAFPTLAVTPTP
jgi:tetratricopeptide (TPR) repeat protein